MKPYELQRIINHAIEEEILLERIRLQRRLQESSDYTKTEILAFIDDKLKKYTQSKELEKRILEKIIAALTNYHRNLFQKKNNWIKDLH